MDDRITEQMVEANKEPLPPWLEKKEVQEGTVQKTYIQTLDDTGDEAQPADVA